MQLKMIGLSFIVAGVTVAIGGGVSVVLRSDRVDTSYQPQPALARVAYKQPQTMARSHDPERTTITEPSDADKWRKAVIDQADPSVLMEMHLDRIDDKAIASGHRSTCEVIENVNMETADNVWRRSLAQRGYPMKTAWLMGKAFVRGSIAYGCNRDVSKPERLVDAY